MKHDARLQLAPGVNYQSLGEGEDGVLLSLQSGYLYRCNHTAISLLDLLRDRPTRDELLTDFASRYGLQREQARGDVLPLLEDLLGQQLIEKAA
jgi:hypothetical protein